MQYIHRLEETTASQQLKPFEGDTTPEIPDYQLYSGALSVFYSFQKYDVLKQIIYSKNSMQKEKSINELQNSRFSFLQV